LVLQANPTFMVLHSSPLHTLPSHLASSTHTPLLLPIVPPSCAQWVVLGLAVRLFLQAAYSRCLALSHPAQRVPSTRMVDRHSGSATRKKLAFFFFPLPYIVPRGFIHLKNWRVQNFNSHVPLVVPLKRNCSKI